MWINQVLGNHLKDCPFTENKDNCFYHIEDWFSSFNKGKLTWKKKHGFEEMLMFSKKLIFLLPPQKWYLSRFGKYYFSFY